MIDRPYVYPFYAEEHLRRGRTVLRPVVRVSLAGIVVDALVDTGSEHVLADSALAVAAGIDLSKPFDVEEIGLGGGVVVASFVSVTAVLHHPDGPVTEPATWEFDVGFIDDWRPLYSCILGNIGFLDQFTVTSRAPVAIDRVPITIPAHRSVPLIVLTAANCRAHAGTGGWGGTTPTGAVRRR